MSGSGGILGRGSALVRIFQVGYAQATMGIRQAVLASHLRMCYEAKRPVRLLAGLLALCCPVAAGLLTGRPDFAFALAVFLFATVVALLNRCLTVPLLILALPLEISKLWFPFLPPRGYLGGGLPPTSIVDLGRLLMALTVLLAVWEGLRAGFRLKVTLLHVALLVLLSVYLVSLLYTRSRIDAVIETVRLAFFILVFLALPQLVSDRRTFAWCLAAFLVSAGGVALIAVYQGITGHLFWNTGLLQYGQYRVNSVFGDPNHLARFLIEALALSLATLAIWQDKRRSLALSAIVVCLPALLLTSSRAGWLIAALVLPVMAVLLPRPRLDRRWLLVVGAGLTVIVLLTASIIGPYLADRLRSFGDIQRVLGPRSYLVAAGIAMFRDHPIGGVGLAGFQKALQPDYAHFIDPTAGPVTTLSHTTVVTIAAELGLIGLAAFALFLGGWAQLVAQAYRLGERCSRAFVLGLTAAGVTLLLASQSAGRFFEDPYLWLILGLTVALWEQAALPR